MFTQSVQKEEDPLIAHACQTEDVTTHDMAELTVDSSYETILASQKCVCSLLKNS